MRPRLLSLPSWASVGRRFSSTRSHQPKPSAVVGWVDTTELSTHERWALEESLLTVRPAQGKQDNASPLLLAGLHRVTKAKATQRHALSAVPTALVTTLISPHSPTKRTKRESSSIHSHLEQLYDAFLEAVAQRHAKQSGPPKKTLIMESKACCGIGTTGTILSLQEIQSKQREQLSLESRFVWHDSHIIWNEHAILAAESQTIRNNIATGHQNQADETSFVLAHRTIWHWDVDSLGSDDDDDQADPRKTLGEVFPHVTPNEAFQTLQDVVTQSYMVDRLAVQDVFLQDDVSSMQASTF